MVVIGNLVIDKTDFIYIQASCPPSVSPGSWPDGAYFAHRDRSFR